MTPNSRSTAVWSLVPCLFALLLQAAPAGVRAGESIKTGVAESLFTLGADPVAPLSLPTDVAVDAEGQIHVVDGGNNRVVVFNRRGQHVRTIGRKGSQNGEFRNPVGIGADRKGLVYVADKDNHRVQVFSADGRFQFAFPVQEQGRPVRPVDVAVSADGDQLYVTGNNNHKVMVYTAGGKYLRSFGGEGVNKGEFRYPATIAVAKNGRVYVVDVFNTRVQVFDATGKFILEFSEWGVLPGQVVRPKGVGIDQHGRVYVSDSYTDVVQVFDDAHLFSHVLGKSGKPYRFVAAAGIAIDTGDRLYVAEVLENRVSVYQLGR